MMCGEVMTVPPAGATAAATYPAAAAVVNGNDGGMG